MNMKITDILCAIALVWGLCLPAFAKDEVCFFRGASTQQMHIVQLNSSSGIIAWTNEGQDGTRTVEMASSLSGAWTPVICSDISTTSNGLIIANIPNMLPKDLPFSEINLEYAPLYYTQTNAVVRSEEEWVTLWQEQITQAPVPDIDFTNEMIVVISMGMQPYAGAVWIENISLHCGYMIIQYKDSLPRGIESGYTAVSWPRCFVRLHRHNLPILWKNITPSGFPMLDLD